jgi:CRISPR-associated protein Cas2
MTFYFVCYDIADDKRRDKVFKALLDYGIHRQFSVFECKLAEMDYLRLKARVGELIDRDEDQVLFIPLNGECYSAVETLGQPRTVDDGPAQIF